MGTIEDYLKRIRSNGKANLRKGILIMIAQISFAIGVATIPVFICFIIDAINKHMLLTNGLL